MEIWVTSLGYFRWYPRCILGRAAICYFVVLAHHAPRAAQQYGAAIFRWSHNVESYSYDGGYQVPLAYAKFGFWLDDVRALKELWSHDILLDERHATKERLHE